jgi:hypothetical protein
MEKFSMSVNENPDVDIGIEDFKITEELNQIAAFTFTTANTTDMRALFESPGSGANVVLYRDGVQIFKGRIDADKVKFSVARITISGYASYIDLHFKFYSKDQGQYDIHRVQYDNIDANTILGEVLAGTGYSVAECPSNLISLRGEYESKLQWISAISNACKYVDGGETFSCDWWIDSSNGVHIAQTRGSDKGRIYLTTDVTRELDFSNIQNSVYGLGYGDGINQVLSSKTNSTSVSTYGEREVTMVDRRFQDQDSLDDETQEHADGHSTPTETISTEITTWAWYDKALEVGDTVTVINEETGINGSYRIKRADIGVVVTKLDLANIVPRLTSDLQSVQRDLKINASYMQGQTVPLNFSNMDNVQSGYPLTLNIHVPSKTKAINAFYLSFDLMLYRAFVATTAGESTHTHGFEIEAHRHSLGLWNDSESYDTYVLGMEDRGSWNAMVLASGGPSAATSENGGALSTTTATGSEHTHAPEFGIMEDSDNSPSISIKIDNIDRTSALGGPWTADQLEIDITPYIQSTGKHSVELLSTQPARIQADAWGQVFIQSD